MAQTSSRLTQALLAFATLGATACVQSYGGSNLQMDFNSSTQIPAGSDPDGSRAPAGTYLAFYGVDNVYDPTMVDGAGNPVITQSYLFEVKRFEIKSEIDLASPCFIELDDAQFPGVHVTQVGNKLRSTICDRLGLAPDCFDNPLAPPDGATDNDVTDVLDVDRRMSNLPPLGSTVGAVVTYSTFQYPTPATGCDFTGDELPAVNCTDDASNAQRLRVCTDLWSKNLDYYEGSDKVYTLPLNGHLYGMVDGTNPVNGAGVGGSSMFVDDVLSDFDAFAINWQYKDFDGDGNPDYPAGFLTDHQESNVGYPFMIGTPMNRVRGVISARLSNPNDPGSYVDVAAFADLADDNVHF